MRHGMWWGKNARTPCRKMRCEVGKAGEVAVFVKYLLMLLPPVTSHVNKIFMLQFSFNNAKRCKPIASHQPGSQHLPQQQLATQSALHQSAKMHQVVGTVVPVHSSIRTIGSCPHIPADWRRPVFSKGDPSCRSSSSVTPVFFSLKTNSFGASLT